MVGEILENYLAPFVWRRGLGSDEPFRVGWLVVVRGSRFEVRDCFRTLHILSPAAYCSSLIESHRVSYVRTCTNRYLHYLLVECIYREDELSTVPTVGRM